MRTLAPGLAICFAAFLLTVTVSPTRAQQREETGSFVTSRGNNSFALSAPQKEYEYVIDPIDGKQHKTHLWVRRPAKMNGKQIHILTEVKTPPQRVAPPFEEYLLRNLTAYFRSLKMDGVFRMEMTDVITDEQGHVVYYEFGGTQGMPKGGDIPRKLGAPDLNMLDSLIANAPAFKAAERNGVKVLAYTDVRLSEYRIDVAKGVVNFTKDGNSLNKTVDFAPHPPLK